MTMKFWKINLFKSLFRSLKLKDFNRIFNIKLKIEELESDLITIEKLESSHYWYITACYDGQINQQILSNYTRDIILLDIRSKIKADIEKLKNSI